MLLAEIDNGDEQVKADAIRIGNYTDGQFPTDSKEFAKRIFYTVFMGSENRLVHVHRIAAHLSLIVVVIVLFQTSSVLSLLS
jgi:NAD+ synthase (glutamine-hydrolysing)